MIVQDIISHCLQRITQRVTRACILIMLEMERLVNLGHTGGVRTCTCAYSTYTGSVCCLPNACMLYPAVAILCV